MLPLSLLTIAMPLLPKALSFHAINARPVSVMAAAAFHPSSSRHRSRHCITHRDRCIDGSGSALRIAPANSISIGTRRNRNSRFYSLEMMADENESETSFIYTSLDDNDDDNSSTTSLNCQRDLQHVLHIIERAAYTAGKVALSTAGQIAVKTTKANTRDLVTESDVECQRLIKEIILNEFPKDVFLGEEDVGSDGDSSVASSGALKDALGIAEGSGEEEEDRLLFVVDPIDGTTNFQAGLPIYAMSIGVVSLVGNIPEVVAGVIYNPTLGEMTSAVRGRGCYLNNKRINPNPTTKNDDKNTEQTPPRQSILSESLINVGFPVCKESTLLASSRAVTALATQVRGLRMVACASQAMAWVAHSKFAAYFSWDLNAWDIAAGMVIVEESGGRVDNFDGSRADVASRDMIISCRPEREGEEGVLRDELIRVLEDNDCVEY